MPPENTTLRVGKATSGEPARRISPLTAVRIHAPYPALRPEKTWQPRMTSRAAWPPAGAMMETGENSDYLTWHTLTEPRTPPTDPGALQRGFEAIPGVLRAVHETPPAMRRGTSLLTTPPGRDLACVTGRGRGRRAFPPLSQRAPRPPARPSPPFPRPPAARLLIGCRGRKLCWCFFRSFPPLGGGRAGNQGRKRSGRSFSGS